MLIRMAESVILPCMSLLSRRPLQVLATVAIAFAATLPGSAQSRAAVTVDDYMRAEKFLGYNTNPLVSNGAVQANWLPGDRFWYRNQGVNGPEFILVDASKRQQVSGIQSRSGGDGADRSDGQTRDGGAPPLQPDHGRRRPPILLVQQRL